MLNDTLGLPPRTNSVRTPMPAPIAIGAFHGTKLRFHPGVT